MTSAKRSGAWGFAQTDGMLWVPLGYFIGKYLVTNIEYGAFVDATGHRPLPRHWRGGTYRREEAHEAVVGVSWHDALKYCEWVSHDAGRKITLPTEAQLKKAACNRFADAWQWCLDAANGTCTIMRGNRRMRRQPEAGYPSVGFRVAAV